MFLTILTPTYNREKSLVRLFESLEHQTNTNFEWIVVDDGSTDDTRTLVDQLSKRSKIGIKYLNKINGGKHTALNCGLANASGDLIFIVDSDDWLTPDAVESIYGAYEEYRDRKDICGFSFLRKYPDGEINGSLFKEDRYIASYIQARINSNDTHADKAEVYYARVLNEFPFPEFLGEKFLGEDIVWIRIARKYKMVHLNKAIYIGDYLSDGLTNNRRINNINSPVGCFNRAIEFSYPDIAIKQRIKGCIQLIVYGKFAGKSIKEIIGHSHARFLTTVLIPVGFVVYRKWSNTYLLNESRG